MSLLATGFMVAASSVRSLSWLASLRARDKWGLRLGVHLLVGLIPMTLLCHACLRPATDGHPDETRQLFRAICRSA